MYDRDKLAGFTEHALRVLNLAEVERQYLQDKYVGTEHLLLGLVGERKGLAAKVLNDFGLDPNKVRNQIVFTRSRGASRVAPLVSLTPQAQTMLEYAACEACRLNDQSIGTGHLLSGLVRAGEGIAIDILESLGVDRVHIRKRTLQLLNRMERSYTAPASLRQFSKRETTTRNGIPHMRLVPLQALRSPSACAYRLQFVAN
jgi:ATP-dependent Clp protease ATP-binding subunit ClpC